MSVVDVNCYLFGEIVHSTVNSQVLVNNVLNRSGNKEILLTESERFSLGVVVCRVKYL